LSKILFGGFGAKEKLKRHNNFGSDQNMNES
jgi:hypothetical protein